MIENKRFTRSYTSTVRNTCNSEGKIKELVDVELRIKKATIAKKYNQALTLVNSITPQNHWSTCKKAQLLFQLGRTLRSLNSVRSALRIQRNNCAQCLKLLLKIIERSQPHVKPFSKDIENCLGLENLPPKIKSEFLYLSQQLQKQQDLRYPMLQQDLKKIQQFTSYYVNKGLMFKKVQIVQLQQQYRVARAKSTIKANQVIIFVPQKQMITLEMAKQFSEISKLSVEQSNFRSPKHCILSTFLLVHMEKGKDSTYFNYIECLPKNLTNFPIYFSNELLEELKGTYFLTLINRKKADIEEDYRLIIKTLPQLQPIITYEKFIWARMIVSSRIFGVIINGKKTDALVPIADMLNHKIPKMTSWYFSDEKRGFVVQNSDEQILKGNQIFDSYGYKCNSRFLLNYGFTMPENTCNEVLINLKRKRNFKSNIPNIKLTTDINSEQFKLLLTHHRQTVSQFTSIDSPNMDQVKIKSSGFISDRNECEAWRLINQTMKEQLSQYKTSIKKDEQLLRCADPIQFNLRNCIVIRLGEKKVLDFYQKMSKKMIDYFSHKRRKINVSEYETYLKDVHQFTHPSSQ